MGDPRDESSTEQVLAAARWGPPGGLAIDRAVASRESCRLVNVPAWSGFADKSGRRAWCRRAKAVSLGENGCKQPRGPAGYGEQYGRNPMTSQARNDFAPADELYGESWENTRELQGPAYKRAP